MKSRQDGAMVETLWPNQPGTASLATRSSYLRLVTAHELADLRQSLAKGGLPRDFEAKLVLMAEGGLLTRAVARSCRCFEALLLAVQEGAFREADPADCERLLRVLAYVRKDDDAIADYSRSGFVDDQEEVRAAEAELAPLLRTFKAWRLCHQVPRMWLT